MKRFLIIILLILSYHFSNSQCAISPALWVDPLPPANGYLPGTTVTFTLTVNGFQQMGTNWFHGVVLNYDSTWDISSLKPISSPASCDGHGYWQLYDSCLSIGTGVKLGPGFFYDSNLGEPSGVTGAGSNTCCLDGDPGNNYGDNSPSNLCSWSYVWSIKTNAISQTNIPLNGGIQITSDGISGSWQNYSCAGDVYSFKSLFSSQPCSASMSLVGYPVVLGKITFSNNSYTSSGKFSKVIWDFGDGTIDSSNFNSSHSYFNSGTYDVCLSVTDSSGCSDKLCFPLNIVDSLSSYNSQSDPYYISGSVFNDADSNGLKSSEEMGLSGWIVKLMPGNISSLTNEDGHYYFNIPLGNYTVQATANPSWSLSSDSSVYSINIANGYHNSNAYNFGFNADSVVDSLSLFSKTDLRYCFYPESDIVCENRGTQVVNGFISFSIDSNLHVDKVNSFPEPDTTINHVLFWNVTDLFPFQSERISITYDPIDIKLLGDTIHFTSVFSASDSLGKEIISVHDTSSEVVTCSKDPNDKRVTPPGDGDNHNTNINQPLTYTIHFQNTGNDTARTVIIRDTLSANLDLHSFRFLGSSYPCYVHLLQNREITFEFIGIMLPDSGVNQIGSNGWVSFIISPLDKIDNESVISNQAEIYFDFNSVVMTNNVFNTLVDPSILTRTNFSSLSDNSINIFPNPSDNNFNIRINAVSVSDAFVSITDILSRKIFTLGKSLQKGINDLPISLNKYPSGVYFVTIKIGDNFFERKIIKNPSD